jgi:hypothetical protein
MSPLPGSPVIDQGTNFGITTDQRGRSRPFDNPSIPNAPGGDGSDIGAIEFYPPISLLVITNNDSGPGSLRQAISDAAPGDTITFISSLAGPIDLTSGELLLDKSLNITGPAADTLVILGDNQHSILHVTGGPTTISGLTISDGGQPEGTPTPAINSSASLVLSNCTVSYNNGQGVGQNTGSVILLECSFLLNNAGGLTIAPGATASVTNCTFYRNQANPYGGAIYNLGTLRLMASTLYETIAITAGGGIYSAGTVNVGDTIVAFNSAGVVSVQDVTGTFNSLGYNFISASDGSTGFANGVSQDQVGTSASYLNPMLGPLQNNGGTTLTLSPQVGSPVIDRGNSFGLTKDQRGYLRPLDFTQMANAPGGDGSDIGAVETGSGLVCGECATQVTVDVSQTLRTADARWFGANAAIWVSGFDSPGTLSSLSEMGCQALRFPGGSFADEYHWESNYIVGASFEGWPTTFGNFADIATNLGANVFITVNYGTGTTNEAADWVRSANITNYYGFKYWEVGNECYFFNEMDSNNVPPYQPHDPWTYAMRFRDYYTSMKAVDPAIKVGIVGVPGDETSAFYTTHPAFNPRTGQTHYGWVPVVLTTLKSLGITPDFMVHHFYPEYGVDSDPFLLQAAANWANDAADLRQQINDYFGNDGTNIELVCTENNADAGPQGKQSTSLVNGLYLADSLGQIMKTEFNAYIWWDWENGQDTSGDFDPALYGWRTYGDLGLALDANTRYPVFYAMKLMQYFAQPGDAILNATSGDPFLAVYAARKSTGTVSLLAINKDPTNTLTRQIVLTGFVPNPVATIRSFGIPQDEAARTNAPLVAQDIATGSFAGAASVFAYSFPPYSLTLFTFAPPGAPLLNIFRTGTNTVVIQWPSPSAGWNLQQNTDLTTTNWNTPLETISDNGTNRFIIVSPSNGNTFFRLSNP